MTTKTTLANVDGQILPLSEVRVSAQDRGFLFGDAVYEVLRVYQGKQWLAEEHYARLERSLGELRIKGIDLPRLRQRVLDTIKAGDFQEALVYIQITRGAAPRRHTFPDNATPFELIYVQEFHDQYQKHREEGIAVITHPDLRWGRCDIKSTNLLGNVLALQAAFEAECHEAILYTEDGHLTECTHTSFFAVVDGKVVTTPQSPEVLPGITRDFVVRLCQSTGTPFADRILQKSELFDVDELFLTGTGSEIMPIVRVDGQPIQNGHPGPITKNLQQAYFTAIDHFLKLA